jgi:hypothetical protein
MSNTITGEQTMQIGGAERPFHIGTLQTAIFCELAPAGFDLQDYHQLFTQIGVNQFYAQQAREKGEPFTPTGRKALTPTENAHFLYSALAAGLRREKQPVSFSVDDVMGWIDDIENSEDEAALQEAAKPFAVHYALLTQKLDRQAKRAGNALAPTATVMSASRGEIPTV